MNDQVMLQVLDIGKADDGGHVDESVDGNWRDLGRFSFLKISGQGSREFYRAQQVQSDITHVVEVWYSPISEEINTSMRWKVGTRVFQIVSALDVDERHERIRMSIREKT